MSCNKPKKPYLLKIMSEFSLMKELRSKEEEKPKKQFIWVIFYNFSCKKRFKGY